MVRYLFVLLMGLLTACASRHPSADENALLKAAALAYPELRAEGVAIVPLRGEAGWTRPRGTHYHLPAFAHHITANANVPARLREFEVTYRAPNRFDLPGIAPVPMAIPDRVEITRGGRVLLNQPIPGGFAGTVSYRYLEVARLRAGGADYLLVVANRFAQTPLWVGIFNADGATVYRAGLPHGAYRMVENADGISLLDQSGSGKRIILLP